MPLAGSRDSVPCGAWGSAPTVPRVTSMPNVSNKGAGSEASLPVTSRVLRRAHNLLFSTSMPCRARWARPSSWSFKRSRFFPQAGMSPLLRRPKDNENRRTSAIARWKPSGAPPCYLVFNGDKVTGVAIIHIVSVPRKCAQEDSANQQYSLRRTQSALNRRILLFDSQANQHKEEKKRWVNVRFRRSIRRGGSAPA